MRIVHTSQGVFFEENDELIPLAQQEAVRIFSFLENDESIVESLKQEIIEKLEHNVQEFIRQINEFDEISIDPVMAYISALMNYRSVCQVAYKQYLDSIEEARNR
jgi:hypothetical protein